MPLPVKQAAPRVRAAGLTRRAIAAVVDAFVLVALFVTLQAISSLVVGHGMPRFAQLGPAGLVDSVLSGSAMAATGLAMFLALCAIYAVWFNAGAGQTLGKRLVGIRVIDGFGRPVGLGRSLVRTVALVPSLGMAGLGVLWIGFDRERRGLHDRLADTHVVVTARAEHPRLDSRPEEVRA
jgi:uncharacterized RDD family membrane protein YckC